MARESHPGVLSHGRPQSRQTEGEGGGLMKKELRERAGNDNKRSKNSC